MDTVVLSGVEYVRASVAAKRFRYTSDYIGQLCRNKKVDARLVGRSWYVNPASIESYRNTRHQTLHTEATSVVDEDIVPDVVTSRVKQSLVVSRIKSVTLKQLADQELRKETTSRTLHVTYEPDHGNLFPELRKLQTHAPRYIKIEPAEAKKLDISSNRRDVSFTPTAMPDVALSGKLKITDYPVIESDSSTLPAPVESSVETKLSVSDDKNDIKNKAISDKHATVKEPGKHLRIKAAKNDAKRVVTIRRSTSSESLPRVPINLPVGDFLPHVDLSTTVDSGNDHESFQTATVTSFTPKLITQKTTEAITTNSVVLASPLIATLLAGVLVLFILLGSARVVVSGDDYNVQLVFQMVNLLDLLQR